MALAEQNFVDTVLEVTRQKMKKIDTGEIQTSMTRWKIFQLGS